MPATSTVGGHLVIYDYQHEVWRYQDSGIAVPDWFPRRCPKCGKMPTPEGYDACLGYIPGAIAACCGHGIEPGYIMYEEKEGRMPQDSTGKPIDIGSRVRFRGEIYTIKGFSFGEGALGTAAIKFEEDQHTSEVADEVSVDRV